MDKNQFWKLKESLQPGESLIVQANNVVRHSTGNKKIFIGKLEDFPETVVPLINKPFATPYVKPHLKSDFGKILPKFDKNPDEIQEKIKKWTMLFEAAKALGFEITKSIVTDTFRKFSYEVEEIAGVKVYYSQKTGNPIYIEYQDEKLDIPNLRPEQIRNPR